MQNVQKAAADFPWRTVDMSQSTLSSVTDRQTDRQTAV